MKIKEILSYTKDFEIKNLLFLTAKEHGNYLKMMNVPDGPTFTFKIDSFCLSGDLVKFLPRNKNVSALSLGVPMVVLKNFNASNRHLSEKMRDLLKSYFSNLFPSLSYHKKNNANSFKRCVMFYYNDSKNQVEIRNYYLKHTFTNINKNIKKMLNSNQIPDFSSMNDVGDLFTQNQAQLSDSDVDHLPDSKVELNDRIMGQEEKYQVNVRLYEIGPRMTLTLVKVQSGLLQGEVLHHSYFSKTKEEKEQQEKNLVEKRIKKENFKKIQMENVRRKEEKAKELADNKKHQHRSKSMAIQNQLQKKGILKHPAPQPSKKEEENEEREEFEDFEGGADFV